MGDFMIFLALICIGGIIYNEVTLGIVFILSLIIVLWTVLSLIQKKKLNEEKMVPAIIGLISLAYTICVLFLHIDLRTILGL